MHGKSRPYEDFTFANVNKELLTILKHENIDEVFLVGQSAGGFIAQAFIQEFEDKVLGFIGVGTTPFGKNYYKKSELFWIKHYATIAKLYPYSYYCKASAKASSLTEDARRNMYKTLAGLGKKRYVESSECGLW